MSGVYNGVQALIKEKVKNPAPFVHCSAHNLNLVLQDCVSSILHVKDFFDCLGQVSGQWYGVNKLQGNKA